MASKGKGGFRPADALGWFLAISLVFAFLKIPAHQSIDGTLGFFDGKAQTIKVWAEGLGDEFNIMDLFNGNAAGTNTGGQNNSPGDRGNNNSSAPDGSSSNTTTAGAVSPTLNTEEASNLLNTITIADAKRVDYDRDEWKHWVTVTGGGGSCWNTRDEVLYRQSDPSAVILLDKDKNTTTKKAQACSVKEGKWVGPFTGKTFTDPSDLDIDHVGALGYVARHGGQEWDADKKAAYANSLEGNHLLAVEAGANRSKSDKGPSEWKPDEAYQCDYAKFWIDSITTWDYSVTSTDQKALVDMLKTC